MDHPYCSVGVTPRAVSPDADPALLAAATMEVGDSGIGSDGTWEMEASRDDLGQLATCTYLYTADRASGAHNGTVAARGCRAPPRLDPPVSRYRPLASSAGPQSSTCAEAACPVSSSTAACALHTAPAPRQRAVEGCSGGPHPAAPLLCVQVSTSPIPYPDWKSIEVHHSSKQDKRTKFDVETVAKLEQIFLVTHYPNKEVVDCLAQETGFANKCIRSWFSNKRARLRKAARAGQEAYLQDVKERETRPGAPSTPAVSNNGPAYRATPHPGVRIESVTLNPYGQLGNIPFAGPGSMFPVGGMLGCMQRWDWPASTRRSPHRLPAAEAFPRGLPRMRVDAPSQHTPVAIAPLLGTPRQEEDAPSVHLQYPRWGFNPATNSYIYLPTASDWSLFNRHYNLPQVTDSVTQDTESTEAWQHRPLATSTPTKSNKQDNRMCDMGSDVRDMEEFPAYEDVI